MLGYVIFGVTYAFAAAVQPGPLQTHIISQTLSRGWKQTLPASFSPILSDGPIIVLVLLVLSQVPPWLVQFLHFAGALFLFYLTFSAFKAWQNQSVSSSTDIQQRHQTLFKAALVNILNPNPYLGWTLVMGPLFLKGYRETPVHGIALLLAFYITMAICLAAVIILFGFAKNLGPRVNHLTLGFSVVALACFGIYQLWLGINPE
jgi:threonine/homoserine/homoserine lactone efflux protein